MTSTKILSFLRGSCKAPVIQTLFRPSFYRCMSTRSAANEILTVTGKAALQENRRLRIELAAAYREFNRLDMNEGIDNHLSVMAPAANGSGEDVMLIIPYGLHWSEVTTSNLVALDKNGDVVEGEGKPNYTTGPIHFTLHQLVPDAKCIFHLHPTYATALACLKDPTVHLLYINSAILADSIAYDKSFAGFAECEDEGHRLAAYFGPRKRILMMGNHGVLVTANDVATAFHDIYYLERSCMYQVIAMSTGKELNILQYSTDFGDTAENFLKKYRTPENINPFFESVKRRLIKNSPDFLD